MELKDAFKEELKVTADKLKAKGIDIGMEYLEDVSLEISDLFARVAVKSDNSYDNFFAMIKPMLDKELDKIDGKEG